MMKILAIGIIIVLVGAVVVSFYVVSLMIGSQAIEPEEPQFQWEVDVGDEFLYEVKVHGSNNNVTIPVPYVRFNNTRIRMTIITLPNVTLLDSSDEIIDIIEYLKIQCEFVNGTAIPTDSRDGYYMNSSIAEILFRAIMPIDGWTHINDYFPDDFGQDQYSSNTYLSKIDQQWFYIGYYYYHIDFGYRWDANVSLSSGSPISIIQWENDPICIGYYAVTLTMADET